MCTPVTTVRPVGLMPVFLLHPHQVNMTGCVLVFVTHPRRANVTRRVHSFLLVYRLIACICMIDRSVILVSAVCITPLTARVSQRESMFAILSVVFSETIYYREYTIYTCIYFTYKVKQIKYI